LIELIFVPLYGDFQKEKRQELARSVISYELDLLKKDQSYEKLVVLTLIMCNKILDEQTLYDFYEEVKNMLDILDIARKDGEQKGLKKGLNQGMLQNAQEMLMDTLEAKLDIVPPRIVDKIKSIDRVDTLKSLFRHALRCDNVNNFEGKLMLATA